MPGIPGFRSIVGGGFRLHDGETCISPRLLKQTNEDEKKVGKKLPGSLDEAHPLMLI